MGRKKGHDCRKSHRKKLKKRRRVVIQNSVVKKSWVGRLSVKANFDRMGLVFDSNEAIRKTVHAKEPQSLTDTTVIRDLKKLKKLKGVREKFISEDDRFFCAYLLELYGDDYGSMCRDPRNVYQLTSTQIRRLISTFRESKHYQQYLKDKSENSLRVLELYE